MELDQLSLNSNANLSVTSDMVNCYVEITDSPDKALLKTKTNHKSRLSIPEIQNYVDDDRMEEHKDFEELNVMLGGFK